MQFMVTFGIAACNGLSIKNAVGWEYITVMCLVVPGSTTAQVEELPIQTHYSFDFYSHQCRCYGLYA